MHSIYLWSGDHIITFLEILRKYEALWNASASDYMKRDRRDSAYSKMISELHEVGFKVSIDEVKKKSLKDAYRTEVNKVKKSTKSGVGTEDIYKPKLAWFTTADSFLRNIITGRESSATLFGMNEIKEEPDSDGEACTVSKVGEYLFIDIKQEHCPPRESPSEPISSDIKDEDEESWDDPAIKDELKVEITTEEHEIHLHSVEQMSSQEGSSLSYVRQGCVGENGSPVLEMSPDGRLYNCETCSMLLVKADFLKHVHNHVQKHREHNNERLPARILYCKGKRRPYTCEVCNKSFLQRGHITRHIRIHTYEKPFTCEICNKGFSRNENLKTHVNTHIGYKPYKCDICSKDFSQKGHLAGHIRTHMVERPFQCEICNKTFALSQNLKTHQYIHTGQKPYRCQVCNKTFSRRGYLVSHMCTHTQGYQLLQNKYT